MKTINYNPDVLSCLANLSNDEVFTPPEVANRMLDMLPEELWNNPDATFLDPGCKTGVFLREIAKRLIKGLAAQIPDLQKRIDHIFQHQLYAIAITELTGLISRRSLYCSKTANGEYSITTFNNADGNIKFERTEHEWVKNRCRYCGASQSEYDRGDELETHAYQFIHTENPETIFNMKFDVIIGNPPYQLGDGGGRGDSARPLYNQFIDNAKKLDPHYLIMVIPARWYSGGKGLDEFRDSMLNDKHLMIIHDFIETVDVFPGLNIRGGICYFLWNKDYSSNTCQVFNHVKTETNMLERPLLEKGSNIFIRFNKAISILRKIQNLQEDTFVNYVSSRKPFGLDSNFDTFQEKKTPLFHIRLYRFGDDGYISDDQVVKGKELINKYKVIVSKASPGGDDYPHSIVSTPIISEPNSVCTETYLVIKDVANLNEAENLVSYIKTRMFRFIMSLVKNTQNISKSSYRFVPLQDFSEPWTDEKLYKKYGLTQEEIKFIESMIRPME